MRYPRHAGQIIEAVLTKQNITGAEFKVFARWLIDKPGFVGLITFYADVLGIPHSNVSRSFKALADKNILILMDLKKNSPEQRSTPIYDLHPNFKEQVGLSEQPKQILDPQSIRPIHKDEYNPDWDD